MSAHRFFADASKASTESSQSIGSSYGGAVFAFGDTVPTNGSSGYAHGCIFVHTTGSGGDDTFYVNSGTKSSCAFTAGTSVAGADFGSTGISADVISESTSAAGVTVDGVRLKDGGILVTAASTMYGQYENVSGASKTVLAADSGKTFIQTASSGTTVFTLPATAAGLTYTFVCANAGGEINISPNAADKIQGKGITAADDKDWINTGATNAIGDLVTIVGDGVDGWWVVGERGTWAREA